MILMDCLKSQDSFTIADGKNSEQKKSDDFVTSDKNHEKGPISQYLEKSFSESSHDGSQLFGRLRPIGPVIAALNASGSAEANTVMILEKIFLQMALRNITDNNSTDESTQTINDSSVMSSTSVREMDSREQQDGHLYSACMTNPPFYDENEEVR